MGQRWGWIQERGAERRATPSGWARFRPKTLSVLGPAHQLSRCVEVMAAPCVEVMAAPCVEVMAAPGSVGLPRTPALYRAATRYACGGAYHQLHGMVEPTTSWHTSDWYVRLLYTSCYFAVAVAARAPADIRSSEAAAKTVTVD